MPADVVMLEVDEGLARQVAVGARGGRCIEPRPEDGPAAPGRLAHGIAVPTGSMRTPSQSRAGQHEVAEGESDLRGIVSRTGRISVVLRGNADKALTLLPREVEGANVGKGK